MPDNDSLYTALCEPFSQTYKLRKGGVDLDYLSTEQVVTRLNEVLGVDGWDFDILEHGQDEHHCWVHGSLTVCFPGRRIHRSQFGECATNRGMTLGDCRKGACSDALKKCASLIGVGLYLSSKQEQVAPEPAANGTAPASLQGLNGEYKCETCAAVLKQIILPDGSARAAAQLAAYTRSKYGKVLCASHYQQARDAAAVGSS